MIATTLPVHPLADLIPEMSADEYGELLDSLRAYGYQPHQPVLTFEGQVLDGRHRQRACAELGIEPRYAEYEGDSPEEYILLANVHRRHLTTAQRAMIVLEILPAYKQRAKERQAEGLRRGDNPAPAESRSGISAPTGGGDRARDEAAEKFGISGRTVAQLDRVKREAPDLYEQVKAGEKTVYAAHEEVRGRIEPGSRPSLPNGELTGRDATRANAHKRRFIEAASTINGIALGLDNLDIARVRAAMEPTELDEWDRLLGNALILLNNTRRALPYDDFTKGVLAGDEDCVAINQIVEAAGLSVADQARDGTVRAITALRRIYEQHGPEVLATTLSVCTTAWGRTADACDGQVISGVGLVLGRYTEAIDVSVLIHKLAKRPGGPPALIGDARGLKKIEGGAVARCIARLIVTTYNRGRRTQLPPL